MEARVRAKATIGAWHCEKTLQPFAEDGVTSAR